MGYQFKQFEIPDYMMPALEGYCRDGLVPGEFLQAVLCNDLREAVGRADHENLPNLPAYVGYLYNEADSRCWGSVEKVAAWIMVKVAERAVLGSAKGPG